NWLNEAPANITASERSLEHGSYIIEGLETGRLYRGHFNVINQGHITNLPDGCVIEIPGYVDHNGINMPVVGDLPMAITATCSASVHVQQMGMEAAVHGDVMLLKQAMLHDPLVAAVCNPEEVWQMTDEMLVAQSQWLPNYAPDAIADAAKRLDDHEANGTRVRLLHTEGAARLHTRTPEEMAQDEMAKATAKTSDKG
ncbi:MAG: alpha-glucosidase/alpha-galactosidase, partial [Anaerolineae bacterium]|nr:alpha-glucosidase/alpha-galactosidase [Anaerolineae bacterium]